MSKIRPRASSPAIRCSTACPKSRAAPTATCARAHTRLRGSAQRKGRDDAVSLGVDAGLCLISGARQSVGAAQLWTALAQDYRHGFVDIDGRALRYLGETVADDVHGALHTRRLMLGHGWEIGEFARAAGMAGAACM